MLINGDTTDGSPIVTSLRRTDHFTPGLFVYGSGIKVETKVLTVDNDNQITLNKNCTATATGVQLDITASPVGSYYETKCAMKEAERVCNYKGDLLQFFPRDEDDVSRDEYDGISKRNNTPELFVRTYPIIYSPNRFQVEKAGLREDTTLILYTPKLTWDNAGYTEKSAIDATYSTVRLRGETHEYREVNYASQFNDNFLYVVFGLQLR
jgi:hypothetical protein